MTSRIVSVSLLMEYSVQNVLERLPQMVKLIRDSINYILKQSQWVSFAL